jgi:DNA-binding NarL/FixJ family response regulator
MTPRPYNLSDREVQILTLLADGHGSRQICGELFITNNTLKSHLYRISKRMGCGERAGMVSLAYRAGVLRIPGPELMRQATELVQRQRAAKVAA